MTWIAVAIGGALGSMARHFVNLEFTRRFEQTPYATFTVNIIGCIAIGALAGLIASGRMQMSPTQRAFVFVGILGGFTTFSSFGLDTFTLAHGGAYGRALANVAGQLVLGLGGVWLGYAVTS